MSSVLHLGPELGSCPVQAASFQEPPGTSLAPVQGRLLFRGPTYTGLVWFITGAGSRHYVCVVGAAPLQRHPTVLNIFGAGSGV